ncbi:MAG: GDP-mannose 4,6-dehydratase [Candidatus Woesearchaeota archaeon]
MENMVDFWKGKKALVSGADGFVGSWVAKKLIDSKAQVVAIVRDEKAEGNLKILGLTDKITIVRGDITDLETVERTINEYEIDSCFHLAAQAIVGIANRSPLSTFNSNIKGTWTVLEACRRSPKVERIVVASSDKAYGTQKKLPYTEDAPLLGSNPYDASKACTDIVARSYYSTYSLPVAVTRCANIYGGGDLNFSRIIPDAIRCILANENFVIRSDGTPERDYMYVEDAASAYLTLAEQCARNEVKGQAFNFGTGTPVSVLALFAKIAGLCGKEEFKPTVLGQAKNEIDRQFLDSNKAKRILNWAPRYSLDDGLKKTIQWYKNYFKMN